MDIFAQATKSKLRFQLTRFAATLNKGGDSTSKSVASFISVEDLWDLGLNDLDVIAIELDAAVRNSPLKSFVYDNTQSLTESNQLKLKLDIVVYIIEFKKAEKDKAAKEKELQQRKQLAKAALAAKTENNFANMTEEQLRNIINE